MTPQNPDQRPPVARSGPRRKAAVGVAAAALAAGGGVADAAKKAGIGRRTLTRWLTNPKFAARVDAMRTEAITGAMNRLGKSMASAADTLTALLKAPRAETRLRAAKAVLELGMKMKEHGELVQRVSDLEQRLASPPPRPIPAQQPLSRVAVE